MTIIIFNLENICIMLKINEFVECLEKISVAASVTESCRYINLKLAGNRIEGDRESSGKHFKLSIEELYQAYKKGVKKTTELRKYISGRTYSPALAILNRVYQLEAQVGGLKKEERKIGGILEPFDEKMLIPETYDEESLAKIGFVGFRPIKECRMDYSIFPDAPGVYIILRRSNKKPEYLKVGSGGHFKDKDPNVDVTTLSDNWVEGASVVYIGMTKTTLHKRISAYMKFGEGRKIGHKGGRYIWQLADHEDLIVCWKEMPEGSPEVYETELILDFKKKHGERRPFANLRD